MNNILMVGGVAFYVVNVGMLVICPLVCGWRVLRDAPKRFVVIKIDRTDQASVRSLVVSIR